MKKIKHTLNTFTNQKLPRTQRTHSGKLKQNPVLD